MRKRDYISILFLSPLIIIGLVWGIITIGFTVGVSYAWILKNRALDIKFHN